MENPLYRNLLISEDATFTTIIIQPQTYCSIGEETDVLAGFEDDPFDTSAPEEREYLTDAENSEAVRAVSRIVGDYRAPDFEIFTAGSPVVTDYLKRTMMKDMRKFLALAVLTISIFLFLMFRRLSGVLLPLLVVILSLLSTVGLMAAAGTPIKLPTQILPSFLLAVTVGDAVHILAIFYHRFRRNGGDKEEAVSYAVGHSGLAVLMTSATTADGLFSFSTADIAPIADLGIFAGLGVLLALVYTLTLLPSLLSLIPIKVRTETVQAGGNQLTDRILAGVGRFATGHPSSILIVSAVVFAVSVAGMSRIRFSHDIVKQTSPPPA